MAFLDRFKKRDDGSTNTSSTSEQTTPPVSAKNTCRISKSISLPKDVNIVASNVIIETQAVVKLIDLAAENTGLLYFLYLIKLIIATVNAINVYAAKAIVVIS